MQLVRFSDKNKRKNSIEFLNEANALKAYNFHKSFPMYEITPLVKLNNLADRLGVKNIFVKDESYRFGLNAFKVLGGSFAIGNYIAKRLGTDISELSYEKFLSAKIKAALGKLVFVTATDGNHGRGIAWTANKLGQNAKVYMPKGSSQERLANILAENADAEITELNYDDTVRLAKEYAAKCGGVLIQDTSWAGYQDVPSWIIQGYTTMAWEAYRQLPEMPTHIFIQAGVGALAAAVTGFFANVYQGAVKPTITIIEPQQADCIFRTVQAADDKLHFVSGDMPTMMAGLACGEPCDIAWKALESYADFAIACADNIAAKGMRVLGAPLPGDKRIISGESGAVTAGVVTEIMVNPHYEQFREHLNLNEASVILCFSTEGATDKANYQAVVWDGKAANFK